MSSSNANGHAVMSASPFPESQGDLKLDEARWARLIPEDQWVVFTEAVELARNGGVEFLLGGAMALATFTGRWRNTKDIDLIVRRDDAGRLIEALTAAGFEDYFEREAYDRTWIFRGFKNGVVLDLIWELPNHRVLVDEVFFQSAQPVQLRGKIYRALGIEELVRVKLYVLQRSRCDWVDVLNLLASSVEDVNWDRLMERMGPELPLLHGVLAVFNWMCPGRARWLPAAVRERFALPHIESDDVVAMEARRVRLLDSRPWFAPYQPMHRPLDL